MQGVGAIVLAAGEGKRMLSDVPKVLHQAAGSPLLRHVLDAAEGAGIEEIVVVVGRGAEMVRSVLGDGYTYALQEQPRGTGDAVLQGLPHISASCQDVVVLCGDTPLLRPETLVRLIAARREAGAAAALLTSVFENPYGYGRILRDDSGLVEAIIEESDATPEQKGIKEVNTGTYVFTRDALEESVSRLQPDNNQGEYYLTDCIRILRSQGRRVVALTAPAEETAGINTREQLSLAEAILRKRECLRLMEAGVTIRDPETTYVDKGVEVGRDTVIYPFTFLESGTKIGRGCAIGPGVRICGATLGDRVAVQFSVIVESDIGDGCQIGPFAYIRPGSVLAGNVKVGDFVELKKAQVGPGSKIPHLSYIGDAVLGAGVNIGAGTITCNYDGVRKHRTLIEDGAFIGSNTNLVAPVAVGKNAVVGAGSTITRDVPADALAVERARQSVIPGWSKKKKKGNEENESE